VPDLTWWLQNFERSAFRLETLPEYNVPQEAELLAKFKRGEPVDLPDDHPWLESVRRHCGAGKLMRRVRVATHPLTDYLRMELSWYRKSVQAGEDIRITETQLTGDFWLFDDQTVVVLHYDSAGRFTGTTTEQGSLTRYLSIRDHALADSMELSAYTARATRS
jgi:hypothetical protein